MYQPCRKETKEVRVLFPDEYENRDKTKADLQRSFKVFTNFRANIIVVKKTVVGRIMKRKT